MSDKVIIVDKLSKKYRIGKIAKTVPTHGADSSRKTSLLRGLTGRFRKSSSDEIFWALNNVSFDIAQGEVIGIVGRNGAGKSTLLKLLSRITEPTSGHAYIKGRVGSLLEVGTGFHPELTGRENIYLNGTILGMRKAEIDRKFDAIVSFAEVGKFINTPVKRYSSGMYVRLAFSVAAHLEPEILLVDEVLAVGDISFQQKCLTRIRNLTANGMTVVLVSHNMAAIQSSCNRAIYLSGGAIVAQGETLDVIHKFQSDMQGQVEGQGVNLLENSTDPENISSGISITGFEMMGEDGISRREFGFGESMRIHIELYSNGRFDQPMINFGIKRGDGVNVCNYNNWYDNFRIDYIDGKCILEGWLPPMRLVPDFYEIHVLVWHWGGGHLAGDLTHSRPVAWSTFGNFRVTGPGLNSHDGVFQLPASKWKFNRGEYVAECTDITSNSVWQALED